MQYTKKPNAGADVSYDENETRVYNGIDDGWVILRDDGTIAAVVDTEAMADALINSLSGGSGHWWSLVPSWLEESFSRLESSLDGIGEHDLRVILSFGFKQDWTKITASAFGTEDQCQLARQWIRAKIIELRAI